MRPDFPFTPPTGWLPAHLVDEITPPTRKAPDDWIVERSREMVVQDRRGAFYQGPAVLIGGQEEDEEEADPPGRLVVRTGEIVCFVAFFDLGEVDIEIAPDGTWTNVDGLPVAPRATGFCERGDGETFAVSLEDLARHHADNVRLSEPETVTVQMWHWSDEVPFVLTIDEAGSIGFREIVDEPAPAEGAN